MADRDRDHYSYSQLHQFETCPYSYFLSRYCNVETKTSAFAQAGTLMHSLLKRWATGDAKISDLPFLLEKEYPEQVTEPFPAFLGESYSEKLYNQCLFYLEHFEGFSGLEVFAAEESLETEIAGERFVGIIDLVLQDKDGEIYLMDHKSSSKVSADMWNQLYLYSKLVLEKYGRLPGVLLFNQFKACKVNAQVFSEEKYQRSLQWAEDTIRAIKEADISDWFKTKREEFFCKNLCSCRDVCSLSE